MRLNDTEREIARGVHARPSMDGRYWDAVMAVIADRDDLLDEIEQLRRIAEAARAIDLFSIALCESEGRGFSCSEIEEYADLMCAIDRHELATEIIGSHALEDTEEDEDMPEHLAAAIEYQKRWSE